MTKPISLKKQEIIDRWENADPDIRPPLVPIDSDHKGSTYAEDSFRVTGSQEWIDWVLARLKPLLEFDSNGNRLSPMYMQTSKRSMVDGKLVTGELTGSYAFYFKCQSRGNGGRIGRVKGSKNKPKEGQESRTEKAANPLREVNAGLKLKAKPKTTENAPVKKQPTAKAYDEPLYAIARGSMEATERDTPDWLEPIDDHPVFKMKTHDDVMGLDDAIDGAMKKHKLKRKDIQKVEITVKDNGELIYEEF
jgi:hypothetical protein